MSYGQIETPDGYLARATSISTRARIGGRPGYVVSVMRDDDLVRSILYQDVDGTFHLGRNMDWTLVRKDGDENPHDWIWTSFQGDMDGFQNVTVKDVEAMGGRWRSWKEEWASMDTDDPGRRGLVWPLESWDEAWNYVQARRLGISLYMLPNGLFPGGAWVAREEDRLYWGQNPVSMFLTRYGQNRGLQITEDRMVITCWNTSGACRWTTDPGNPIMYFQVEPTTYMIPGITPMDGQDQNVRRIPAYNLSRDGKRLNVGQWTYGFPPHRQSNGVEFFDGNPDVPEIMVQVMIFSYPVVGGNVPTATDRWALGPWFRFVEAGIISMGGRSLPPINPMQVRENLPMGGGSCSDELWRGTQMACIDRPIPYTPSIGLEQCTTLDDFQADEHCKLWAREQPTESIESKLRTLCSRPSLDTVEAQYMDVCACFLPDDAYYEALRQRYSQRIAEDVRASNLLQCASGLCTGQEGTFSPSLFYKGSRRCDLCIQAVSLELQDTTVQGDIRIKQLCTQVDPTYTWEDLVERLQNLGAWKIPNPNPVYRHVIVQDENTLILDPRSDLAQESLQHLNLLSKIASKDSRGRLILSKALWTTNPTTYTNEVIVFFLDARPA